MLDADLVAFVLDALPGAPARLLEVGAGSGELAEHLRGHGYDVMAIDPASETPSVERMALAELDRPAAFDAALAVLSLHHVHPLPESCQRLAAAVRPGGALVIDEFDVAAFDAQAARWWMAQHPDGEAGHAEPHSIVADIRDHLHPVDVIVAALEPWFDFGKVRRLPYLYRWKLGPEFRDVEAAQIDSGLLDATGARLTGRRREPTPGL